MASRSSGSLPGRALATLIVTCTLLVGCTSSDEPGDTTMSSTTTTVVEPLQVSMADAIPDSLRNRSAVPDGPRAEADGTTTDTARAATLHPTDFAGDWAVHVEARMRPLRRQTCSYREGGPEAALTRGAARRGPTMQLGTEPAFITSFGYVFPSDDDAAEWITTVRSEEWADCKASAFTERSEEEGYPLSVDLESRSSEHLGNDGFEAFAEFHVRGPDDEVHTLVNVMHYRMGPVVIENTLERSIELSDEDWAAVDDAHSTALATAWARLNAARSSFVRAREVSSR